MSDLHKANFALESFLKKLQSAEVIKEFNLKPMGLNQDNLNEFESAFLKFTQEVNNVLTSHKKTMESCASQLPNASDMNYNQDTDQNCDSNSNDNVQIQVSSEELRRRIEAFKLRKRKQKDERNVQEYCGRPYIDELHPLWGEINSCARVDAVFIPRYDHKSRVKVTRVRNMCGPQIEEAKEIKIDPEREKPECTDSFDAIQERLLSMESHLKLKSDETVKKNFFQRIKELEDRILYLEGICPDYFNLPTTNYESTKKQNVSAREKMYSNWSIDDVQRRIQFLRESLRAKSAAIKTP